VETIKKILNENTIDAEFEIFIPHRRKCLFCFLIYSFCRYQISRIKRSKIEYRIRILISEYLYPRTRFYGENIYVIYNNILSENRTKSVYKRLPNFDRVNIFHEFFYYFDFIYFQHDINYTIDI
jgi:hypothetical protein